MNAIAQILVNENNGGHGSLTSDVHDILDINTYLHKNKTLKKQNLLQGGLVLLVDN